LGKIVNFDLLYLCFYVIALSFGFLSQGFKRKILYCLSDLSLFIGFVIHSTTFIFRWFSLSVIPSRNLGELLDATALTLVLVYFVSKLFLKNREIVFFLSPFIVLFLFVSKIFVFKTQETSSFYTSLWFPIHILLLVSGIALTIFAFIYSTIFIMQDYSLRKRKIANELILSSIETAGRLGKNYIITGFIFLTLGIFAAIYYGISMKGENPDYHPGLLEVGTFLSWLTLGISSFGFIRSSMKPKVRVILLMVGATLFLLIFLGLLWH
jgi:hypothetical protein